MFTATPAGPGSRLDPMSDTFDRTTIEADLVAQGLDGMVDPAEVEASVDLFQTHPDFDPAWTYDPEAGPPEVYAPTAAEMEPDLAPEGWP